MRLGKTVVTMSLLSLPIEIFYEIVTHDIDTWRSAVLSIPLVHRYLSSEGKRIRQKFSIKTETKSIVFYTLYGRLHREDGPAVVIKDRKVSSLLERYYDFFGGDSMFYLFPDKEDIIFESENYSTVFSIKENEAWYRYGKKSRDPWKICH